MRTPAPIHLHQAALLLMIWALRLVLRGRDAVIAAFVVAYLLGAFAPSRP